MTLNYYDIRPQMENGDVIFFTPKHALGWGQLIAWWTKSPIVHCGLVLRYGGRILLLEASETGWVRLYPLSKAKHNFLWVTLKLSSQGTWNDAMEEVAMDRIGNRYDYLGALLAAFNKQRKNNKFYCSELVLDLLQAAGLVDNRQAFTTPADVYNHLTKNLQYPVNWVSFDV